MKLLLVLALVALTTAFHIDNVPEGYQLQSVDTYDCRWMCDDDGSVWANFLECAPDEVAVGTCGVAGSRDCKDPLIGASVCPNEEKGYSGLRCCKAEVTLQKI